MVENVRQAAVLVRAESPGRVFELYEMQRVRCSKQTVASLPEFVAIWQEYIGLMYQGMIGDQSYEDMPGNELASRFLVVSINTSASVFNCWLDGAYVQGLALTRHLLDSWQKVAYTKTHPETANSWLSIEGRPPTPPGQNKIITQLKTDKHYKGNATVVERLYSNLNQYAHASYKMLAAHDTGQAGQIQLGPSFNLRDAIGLARNALPATGLLATEMIHVFDLPDGWRAKNTELNTRLSVLLSKKS